MENRPIKILLELLLKEVIIEKQIYGNITGGFTGMCEIIQLMNPFWCDVVSNEEVDLLNTYLRHNAPEHVIVHEGGLMGYWWKIGDKEPRIEWLKQQIKLQDENN